MGERKAAKQARDIATAYVGLRADAFGKLAREIGIGPSHLEAFTQGCIAGGTAMIAAFVNREIDIRGIRQLLKG